MYFCRIYKIPYAKYCVSCCIFLTNMVWIGLYNGIANINELVYIKFIIISDVNVWIYT